MTAGSAPSAPASAAAAASEDAAWAARLAARDPEALRAMIAAHAGKLHRVAYRMTGDAQEAEDIVQEALLRLWDNAPGIAALRLGGWLQRVVTNLAIDRLRRARRLSSGEVPEREDEAPRADALIEAGERDGLARALVLALPERQRAAIVLTYFEELPNAEAAEAMEMNIKAFESLLHRARAGLRQAFAAQGGAL